MPANVVTPKDAHRLMGVDETVEMLLIEGAPRSRQELLEATNNAAINSSIARIRKRWNPEGWTIKCRRGKADGETIYQRQRLPSAAAPQHAEAWDMPDRELDHMMNQD